MDIAGIRKKLREAKQAARTNENEARTTEEEPVVEQPNPESRERTGLTVKQPAEDEGVASEPVEEISDALADKITEKEEEPEYIIELLIFKLSNEDYAYRVSDVQEIHKPYKLTRVPGADLFILGVTSLRGKIIPVVDIKRKLFISSEGIRDNAKVIILNGPKGLIGVYADSDIDVIRVPEESIMEPPAHLTEEELRFVEGITAYGGRFISIIRTEGIFDFAIKEKVNHL